MYSQSDVGLDLRASSMRPTIRLDNAHAYTLSIIEKDNEESSENEEIMDIMGNRICEFDPKDS